MKLIGILGAGHIGKAAATQFLANGCQVLISNSKGPETLTSVVSQLGTGAKAVTAAEAAAADIVLIAVPWPNIKDLTKLTDWNGKIVIDASNRFEQGDGIEDDGLASSEVVQNYLPGAKVVKAFNTLFAKVLAENPAVGNGKRVLFISGDDKNSKAIVSEIVSKIGFVPIDLGTLAAGGKLQQFRWPLNSQNFIKL
ncbi:putative dinucleotide-binding enzyme [Mucilaginibacter lappiensis]